MAISRQALDQVRSILRDLDKRIDDARHQRTHEDTPEGSSDTASADERPRDEGEAPPPAHTPGRARPKRPSF